MAARAQSKKRRRRIKAAEVRSGRGGRRPGAGRPLGGGLPWAKVFKYASVGAKRDDILTALDFTRDQLADPKVLERLERELKRGAAQHRINLLSHVADQAADGKVNAAVAALRQYMDWDQPDRGGADKKPPDVEAAVAEIETILGRARAPR